MTEVNETEPLWVGMDVDAELARPDTEPVSAPATEAGPPRPKRPRSPRALRGAVAVIRRTPTQRLPLTA
jgi:hypothetical protein